MPTPSDEPVPTPRRTDQLPHEHGPAALPELSDRAAAGRATYARNFGVDETEAHRRVAERAGADFAVEVFEAAGGLAWQSPALTDRDRSIAVIAAMVSQNVTDDRLETYLSLARRNQVDEHGLTALMALLANYVGQPSTSVAMATVRRSATSDQVEAS